MANKDKQELEYNKARETIKFLRDENTDLQLKLTEQVTQLEDQLREYRLRFEYAQKQIYISTLIGAYIKHLKEHIIQNIHKV